MKGVCAILLGYYYNISICWWTGTENDDDEWCCWVIKWVENSREIIKCQLSLLLLVYTRKSHTKSECRHLHIFFLPFPLNPLRERQQSELVIYKMEKTASTTSVNYFSLCYSHSLPEIALFFTSSSFLYVVEWRHDGLFLPSWCGLMIKQAYKHKMSLFQHHFLLYIKQR